jgi:V/A-type H+-transporting ATPase subunit A
MIKFYKEAQKALREGTPLSDIRATPIITTLLKAKFEIPDDQVSKLDDIDKRLTEEFNKSISREEAKIVV